MLVLILLAVLAAAAAAAAARRWPAAEAPVLEAAEHVERAEARGRGPFARRLDPEAATGLALTIALVVLFGGGLLLTALAVVVRHHDGLVGIDRSVADWGARHASGASTAGLHVATAFGETWMAIAVSIVIALVDLRLTRSRWTAAFVVAAFAGNKLLTGSLKTLIDRVRPDLHPVAATLGPSFPSGHSSTAAALWSTCALVALRWWGRRARVPLAALAVGVPVAVAASRVLLDLHWLTDVIAGVALGWAWVAACAVVFGRRVLPFRAPPARPGARRPAEASVAR